MSVSYQRQLVLNVLYTGLAALPVPSDYDQHRWGECMIGQACKHGIAGFSLMDKFTMRHDSGETTVRQLGSSFVDSVVGRDASLNLFSGAGWANWREALKGFAAYMTDHGLWLDGYYPVLDAETHKANRLALARHLGRNVKDSGYDHHGYAGCAAGHAVKAGIGGLYKDDGRPMINVENIVLGGMAAIDYVFGNDTYDAIFACRHHHTRKSAMAALREYNPQ